MLPVAVAATFAVSMSDAFDWTKASDDLRFALLKPVMKYEEVIRLKVGKKLNAIGCGTAKDENGNLVSSCEWTYWYRQKSRDRTMGISFFVHDVYRDPNTPRTDTWAAASAGGHDPRTLKPKQVNPNIVAFRVDDVLYRRNKDGLFVAQSGKK